MRPRQGRQGTAPAGMMRAHVEWTQEGSRPHGVERACLLLPGPPCQDMRYRWVRCGTSGPMVPQRISLKHLTFLRSAGPCGGFAPPHRVSPSTSLTRSCSIHTIVDTTLFCGTKRMKVPQRPAKGKKASVSPWLHTWRGPAASRRRRAISVMPIADDPATPSKWVLLLLVHARGGGLIQPDDPPQV